MLKRLLTLLAFVLVAQALVPVYAATTETEQVTVTATVPENEAPTTPILISPSNNSYTNDSTPSFVWEESTDEGGMSHYELSLDGSNLFDNIPLSDTENDDYILEYNSTDGEYTLTPKSPLSSATHTWKIRAVDVSNQGTDSATWSFTIDTLAPSFVLTQIGTASVSISAQDPSTIPSTPVELTENQPLLVANGEANASVSLTLTIPGDPTQAFSQAIESDGTWELQLGILPRDVVMSMEFIITDSASNVSVLTGVEFIIPTEVIVIPGSPTPTPSPSVSPSPSPSPSPGVLPSPTPTPSPSPTVAPIIEIPIVPPREIIHEIIQETAELLPPQIVNLAANLPKQSAETIVKTAKIVAPVSSLVATAAVPSLSFFALLAQFGQNFSWDFSIKLFQALGLIPKKRPQGIVYDSETEEPVSFALLTVTTSEKTIEPIKETVVTDLNGIYQGVRLPPGNYSINVAHQEYSFPTIKQRPAYMSFKDFYKGEIFEVKTEEQKELFLIPIDPIDESEKPTNFRSKVSLFVARIRLSNLIIPLFIFSVMIALIYPTNLNWIVVAFYLVILTRQAITSRRIPTIAGQVVDQQGNPIGFAIVRVIQAETSQLVAIVTTDKQGEFKGFVDKDLYQLAVTKQGFAQYNESGQLSFEQIDTREQSQYNVITMRNVADIYKELFS